ncbi:MAG: hypothetical protein AAGD07_17670 [Planctomycetota bacterium]
MHLTKHGVWQAQQAGKQAETLYLQHVTGSTTHQDTSTGGGGQHTGAGSQQTGAGSQQAGAGGWQQASALACNGATALVIKTAAANAKSRS